MAIMNRNNSPNRLCDRLQTDAEIALSESSKSSTDIRVMRDPVPGTVVADRYRIERLIARGGMAVVYLAEHIQLHRKVALKLLRPPPEAEDPESFEHRFRLEAKTLAQLDHPNIVTLHDYGETEDGRFFLAMEYVGGPRISELLRAGPMDPQRVIGLIKQVCRAVSYAHRRNIVHRDLKPSNLLIRHDEENKEIVKVVDFGLVKLTSADQTITRAGLILGSPHCMAPEQVQGHEVDERADIYALGILMFRAVSGQYPFHGSNPSATMIAHLNETTPYIHAIAPDLKLPSGFEALVRRCLEKEKELRYPNVEELLQDLELCEQIPPTHYESVSEFDTTIQTGTLHSRVTQTGIAMAAAGSTAFLAFMFFLAIGAVLLIWQPWASTPSVTADTKQTGDDRTAPPDTTGSESSEGTGGDATTKQEPPQPSDENVHSTGGGTSDPKSELQPTTKSKEAATAETSSTRSRRRRVKPEEKKPAQTNESETSSAAAEDASTTEKEESASKAVPDKDSPKTKENPEDTTDTPEGYMGLPDF
jgi:serine/threonine protein kinase